MLLFHGAGASARDLALLGEALVAHRRDVVILSVQAPDAAALGWPWFCVAGGTQGDRPARGAPALPAFIQAIRHWQEACATGRPGRR